MAVIGAFLLGFALLSWHESVNEWSPAIGAIATLAIAYFTYTLWGSTSKMQRATEGSLEQLARQFEADHRPWIKFDFEIRLGLSFAFDSWRLPLTYHLQNVGKTPATNVSVTWALIPRITAEYDNGLNPGPALSGTDVAKEIESVVKEAKLRQNLRPIGWGEVLFPEEIRIKDLEAGFGPGLPHVEEAKASPKYTGFFLLIACVTYGSTYTDELYRTVKLLDLIKVTGNGSIDLNGETISLDDLSRWPVDARNLVT